MGDGSARVNISVYVYNNNFCNVCCLHAADAFSGRTPAPAAADWCESVVYFMQNRIEREEQKAPTKKRPHVNYKRSWLPTIKNRIKRNLLLIFYAVRSFVILLCTSFAMLRILRFILFFFRSLCSHHFRFHLSWMVFFFFSAPRLSRGWQQWNEQMKFRWELLHDNLLDFHAFFSFNLFGGEFRLTSSFFSRVVLHTNAKATTSIFLHAHYTYCYDVRRWHTKFAISVLTRLSVLSGSHAPHAPSHNANSNTHLPNHLSRSVLGNLIIYTSLHAFECVPTKTKWMWVGCRKSVKRANIQLVCFSWIKMPETERVTAWKCRNKQNTIRLKINYIFLSLISLPTIGASLKR